MPLSLNSFNFSVLTGSEILPGFASKVISSLPRFVLLSLSIVLRRNSTDVADIKEGVPPPKNTDFRSKLQKLADER